MVAGAIVGNISAEATTPTGNSFAEAMRGGGNAVSKHWIDILVRKVARPRGLYENRFLCESKRYRVSSWKRLTALQRHGDQNGEPQSAQRK